MSRDTEKAYRVEGMSCAHCEAAVRGELQHVSGVEAVEVDLGSGRVVIRGDFDDSAARAAIGEAGYEVTA